MTACTQTLHVVQPLGHEPDERHLAVTAGQNPNNACNAYGGNCNGQGACYCHDGVKDNGETGVDCGGGGCLKCAGDNCANNGECAGGVCVGGVCCQGACATDGCHTCGMPCDLGVCHVVFDGDGTCGGGMACKGGTCTGGGKNGSGCSNHNYNCVSGNCAGGGGGMCQAAQPAAAFCCANPDCAMPLMCGSTLHTCF